jgi:hypothetical protein
MVSPMTLFTPEDLLLYLYRESSPDLTLAIDTALKEDWMLREKLQEIQSQTFTDDLNRIIVSPRAEVILRVMDYARETAVESIQH